MLPSGFFRSQRRDKQQLIARLGKIPLELPEGELDRAVDGLVDSARQDRLASDAQLAALGGELRRLLAAGDFHSARQVIRRDLRDVRARLGVIAGFAVLTVAGAIVPGALGAIARVLWMSLVLSYALLAGFVRVLLGGPELGDVEDSVQWIEARVKAGDVAAALAEYRLLRLRLASRAGASASWLRVAQANALSAIARSRLELPLHELIADARALATEPGSREHWWTQLALDSLADRVATIDPSQAEDLRALRDQVERAAEAARVQTEE